MIDEQVNGIRTKLKPAEPPGQPPDQDMVWIPGGTFRMGSNDHYPEEAPVHSVTVDGFWMDKYQVTKAQFANFVRETGYVTVAERAPNPEDYPGAPPENLVPGSLVLQKTRSWQQHPQAQTPSRGPHCLRGCRDLCQMGGQGAGHRG
jgi:formylglycine-generating enzyme required for sulfatase activity